MIRMRGRAMAVVSLAGWVRVDVALIAISPSEAEPRISRIIRIHNSKADPRSISHLLSVFIRVIRGANSLLHCRRSMADDFAFDQVDDVLSDIGRVVGDALQVARGREQRQ